MKNNLKLIRESRGIEQSDVARDLAISLSTYRSWEQGSRGLNGEKLIMFAKYFNVSTDTILGTEFSELEKTPDSSSADNVLDLFNSLSEKGQDVAMSVLKALVDSGNYSTGQQSTL